MRRSAQRRDIAWTAGLAALAPAALGVAGAIAPVTAAVTVFAIVCLALIYYLVAGHEEAETAAPPAAPPAGGETAGQIASAMIERLPDPVLLIGPGGRIERANAAARAFLRLPREAANIAGVLRQPEVLEAANAALRGEEPGPVEYRTLAPYESFVRAFVAPLPVGGGGGAILLLHDETDMRRAERMRADFLANASHELRTPLASLAGFIETLRGHAKDDPDARDRFLTIMQAQAERMRRLLNDLLSLSRIELTEHLPPTSAVDLTTVARDVTDALRPIAKARGARIVLSAPEEGAMVVGDRDQLTAVAQNLIDNALKYSPPDGTVTVEVLAGAGAEAALRPGRRTGAGGGRFTIVAPPDGRTMGALRVTDEGPGIAAEKLPRLSQRFYRVEEGKSEDRKGTGLGLAIVKHIVARHRGGFAVESAPGKGSCFAVCIPMAEPAG